MKRALVLGLVVLLVIGSAVAVYAKAQKEDLVPATGPAYDQTGAPAVGFAILNNPRDPGNNLTVQVSLKAGGSGVTYTVFLEEYALDNTGRLGYAYLGDITCNAQGKGNVHFSLNPTMSSSWTNRDLNIMLTSGDHYLQIAIATAAGGWLWATDAVKINLK